MQRTHAAFINETVLEIMRSCRHCIVNVPSVWVSLKDTKQGKAELLLKKIKVENFDRITK